MNTRPQSLSKSQSHRHVAAVLLVLLTGTAISSGLVNVVLGHADTGRLVSIAADDFDEDGVPDLACGVVLQAGGLVQVRRGLASAIYRRPDEPAPQSPFGPVSSAARSAVAPECVAAGDFDNDGHRDVVAGAFDSARLALLPGNGRGEFADERFIQLPGRLTALGSGDVNRRDGLADIAVGVASDLGPQLLVFEGPDGAERAVPEVVALPDAARSIAVGQVDEDPSIDVVAGCGRYLAVVHGQDRKLVAGSDGSPTEGKAATMTLRELAEPIRAVAVADLDRDGVADIGVLFVSGRTESFHRASYAAPVPDVATPVDRDLPGLGMPATAGLVAAAERSNVDSVIAALPMRLNSDARPDLVTVVRGHEEPQFDVSQPAAVFVVTSTDDSGAGSLRDAIELANSSEGLDSITFAISGSGVHTISPLTALPDVTDPVTIDGTTQPGYDGVPLVELDGTNAGDDASGLHILAGGSAVRGLTINRFRRMGDGIGGRGVFLDVGAGNIVEACYFGVDSTGTVERSNAYSDVYVYESAGNTIGGTVADARNVISGNCSDGYGNVTISYDENVTDNVVVGNYIGTDVTGTLDLSTTGGGVYVGGGPNNTVGGTSAGARNVISGNGSDYNGADVGVIGVTNCLVQGNFIGTDPTGQVGVGTSPNGTCVGLDAGAANNTIGGTAAGAANLIGFVFEGITIGEYQGPTRNNAFLQNSIRSIDTVGIGLGYDYVTPNDAGDTDTGPNDFQNYPVLTSATSTGDSVTVSGRLNSTANTSFRVEFFANTEASSSGFGPGETYLGSGNVTTDGTGNTDFSITLPVSLPAGVSVTSTATSSAGSTSEFSFCVELALEWQPPDTNSSDPNPPPRNLTAQNLSTGLPSSARPASVFVPRGGGVTGYNVYRSNQPNVQANAANYFTSVPPSQTAANATIFVGGTFFVVTATYPDGESGPSNEVMTGVPPTLASVKASGSKVVAKGTDFVDPVFVTIDGIPFQSPAKLKGGGTKVVQKGLLVTGESVASYARSRGGTVAVLYRNPTGGVAGKRVSVAGASNR